jgi:hypothetical protein
VIIDEEDYIEHFGVKGMKWGVRKDRGRSGTARSGQKTPRFSAEQKVKAKKVAIGLGVLTVAAGTAYLAYSMNRNGNVPIRSITPPASAKKFVDEVKTQTDLIHASRGKNKGFHFIKSGGLPDPLHDYEKAFGADSGKAEMFRRLDDGRIAAGFLDPQGRSDHAGRMIPHQVLIPHSMASGINNLDDVRNKIWPLLKPTYDTMYEKSLARP